MVVHTWEIWIPLLFCKLQCALTHWSPGMSQDKWTLSCNSEFLILFSAQHLLYSALIYKLVEQGSAQPPLGNGSLARPPWAIKLWFWLGACREAGNGWGCTGLLRTSLTVWESSLADRRAVQPVASQQKIRRADKRVWHPEIWQEWRTLFFCKVLNSSESRCQFF